MDSKFWAYFAWGFLIVNTWCIFIMLELLVWGKAYINLFLIIFAIILSYHLPYLKKNK